MHLARLVPSKRHQIAVAAAAAVLLVGEVKAQDSAPPVKAAPSSKAASAPIAPGGDSPIPTATVIVTANRRAEDLKSFAGSVTPLSGAQLDAIGAQSMADYLTRTPGVSFSQGNAGESNVTIRGVGTTSFRDQGQATTGIFINDVPLTDPYFNVATPDIDTFDVARVEVLRGPQGTTFGSGSLGGAVNYIANMPRLGELEGRVQVGASRTSQSHGDTGYIAKAMLNVPVGDRFAVRGVLLTRDEPGFLHNIGTGTTASNETKVNGGRFMADWEVTDSSRLQWFSLYQKINDRDGNASQSNLGPYARDTAFLEPNNTTTAINSLKLEQDWDFASFSLSATQHQKTAYGLNDYSSALSSLLGGQAEPIRSTSTSRSIGHTVEAKLVSASPGPWQWLAGAFFDRTNLRYGQALSAPGAANAIEATWGPILGPGVGAETTGSDGTFENVYPIAVTGSEAALYGEASWKFAPKWKATLAGRWFTTKVESSTTQTGLTTLLTAGALTSTLAASQKESGFSPKAVIAYQPDPDTLFYGLISKGFRYGGPNLSPSTPQHPTPATFKSDRLVNYELGTRGSSADGRFSADLTAFFIDWSDIQLRLSTPLGVNYADNVGTAHNYGMEQSFTWRPVSALSLQGSVTWMHATLQDAFDPGAGQPAAPAGTELPNASKWHVDTSATYNFGSEFKPFVSAAYRYVSSAQSDLLRPAIRAGGYSLVDLRGGFTFAGVSYTAYADNIANTKGVSNSALSVTNANAEDRYYVRPRTVGLTLDYKFK